MAERDGCAEGALPLDALREQAVHDSHPMTLPSKIARADETGKPIT